MAKNTLAVGRLAVGLGMQVDGPSPRVDRAVMVERPPAEQCRRWSGWCVRFFRRHCLTVGWEVR